VTQGSVSIGGETILAINPDSYNPATVTWQKS
jgi:hypothetical protein